jgi:competence ComEA-like helix-hairpin-helix protein
MNSSSRLPASGWKSLPVQRHLVSTLLLSLFLLLGVVRTGVCQGWNEIRTALLPDSSFALVEVEQSRKIRHCPHHDGAGNLDYEQLIYVLGTFEQESWQNDSNRQEAWKHLQHHYDPFHERLMRQGLDRPLDINRAKLSELVALPRIGPVLAVRIVAYRNRIGKFSKIEEIRKVDGIGATTYNAIRHYIKINPHND